MSRNDFFKQSITQLRTSKNKMLELFDIKRRNQQDIKDYVKAFDYFVVNPTEYDGATIVKDLVDVRTPDGYLDTDAMLHDYEYIQGANSHFVKKWKSDYRYIRNMEMNGKGIRVFRFIILTLAGVILIPYNIYKKRKK